MDWCLDIAWMGFLLSCFIARVYAASCFEKFGAMMFAALYSQCLVHS